MKTLFVLIIALWSFALATQFAAADAPIEALSNNDERTVLWMGTSDGPPYMIQATDSGLDIDIPRAALARMGYDLKLRYMPLARAYMEVQSGRLDLMAPMFVSETQAGFRSEPHVYYRPTAFSLKKNKLQISSLPDLGKFSLMTFQGAKGYFGDVFVKASEQSPMYSEIYNMSNLPRLLAAGRTDVVVLDFYIFQHFKRDLEKDGLAPEFMIHEVFPRVPATVMFYDKQLRDQFNIGLELIKSDGVYQAILDRYSR